MNFIFSILYIYVLIYSLYMLILALRNFKDGSFSIEKKYSIYDGAQTNFAVIIYSHNNRASLENLINQFKMQNYPLGNFKIYAVLDNCTDGTETLFEKDRFIHVLNIQDVGTLGKTASINMLLENIRNDSQIDAYIFIDGTRQIETDFLALANVAMKKYDAVTGELLVDRANLDILDKIKAVYKKYIANFFKKARTLCSLATTIDSGLFIIRKSVMDELDEIDFKDINSELEFSLMLSKTGHKCVYNPNIRSFAFGQDCSFKNPRLTKRLVLIGENLPNLKTTNFAFIEHVFSLLNPNFWLLIASYALLIWFSYNYQFMVRCKTVIFSGLILAGIFCLSLVNARLKPKEILMLSFHPFYSICHIVKNFPLIRAILKNLGANADKDVDKLTVESIVLTKNGERPCKLEFISTESGLAKIRFIYRNKKYTTDSHLRMVDALQQLKSKMNDYGQILKICSCCSKFTSKVDGSTNMLRGQCNNDYPSPLLSQARPTLIWNSCSGFEPAIINSFIEELAKEVENQK